MKDVGQRIPLALGVATALGLGNITRDLWLLLALGVLRLARNIRQVCLLAVGFLALALVRRLLLVVACLLVAGTRRVDETLPLGAPWLDHGVRASFLDKQVCGTIQLREREDRKRARAKIKTCDQEL